MSCNSLRPAGAAGAEDPLTPLTAHTRGEGGEEGGLSIAVCIWLEYSLEIPPNPLKKGGLGGSRCLDL
jgi:hypothetical protein